MHQELMSALLNEDDLGAVIRAHIYLEQDIDHVISLIVRKPDYINKLTIDFSNKLKLAIALGMDEEVYKPLVSISNIRNKFAHNFNMKLNKSDVNNFYKSFVSEDQAVIQNMISKNPDGPSGLAKKFSLLTVKEKFVAMVFYLAIRVRNELKEEIHFVIEGFEEEPEEERYA